MKQLDRSLGLVSVVAISISAMIGSGIFVLPGLAAAHTGPTAFLAYLIAGACVLPAALSKSELATAMPTSGGTYVYLDRAFGPLAGVIAGIALWLSLLLKSAFALVGFSAYLIVLWDVEPKHSALVALGAIVLLNVFGVKKVGKVLIVVASMTIVGLLALVIAGVSEFQLEAMRDPFPHGMGGLLAAAGLVFASYNGVTKVASVAEEIKDPDRNLPLGILLSLGIVAVLYALVALVLVDELPLADLTTDLRPIHTLASQLGGAWAGTAAAVLGVLTLTSMANAGLLAASRYPFAMSRGLMLPSLFKSVHPRFLTPIAGILLTGGAMVAAVLFLEIEKIAKLASATVLLTYVGENLCVVVFRESRARWYAPSFRSPLYPFTQLIGVVLAGTLIAMLGLPGLAGLVLTATPGILLFVIYGRRRAHRRGLVRILGKRRDVIQRRSLSPSEPADSSARGLRQSSAVVALFGEERTPEVLVELGGALAGAGHTSVVLLHEVPEQTALDAVTEDLGDRALRRRIAAVRDEGDLDLSFTPLVSRDPPRTVDRAVSESGAHWLIMGWRGKAGALTFLNPLGWLIDHLQTDLALFYDAGVRHIRDILVYPEPGPDDDLVVRTASRLGAAWSARVTLVRWLPDDADEPHKLGEREYLHQLEELCEGDVASRIVHGPNETDALAECTVDHDLLILGRQRDRSSWRLSGGKNAERITAASACSVLLLQTPPRQTHRASSEVGSHASLRRELQPLLVRLSLTSQKRDKILQEIAEAFADSYKDGALTGKAIYEGLLRRERQVSTDAGDGVAFPHVTMQGADEWKLGVFTLASPVDWGGHSGTKVDVLFASIGELRHRPSHLRALSSLALLCRDTDLLARLRGSNDVNAVLEAFRQSAAAAPSEPPVVEKLDGPLDAEDS